MQVGKALILPRKPPGAFQQGIGAAVKIILPPDLPFPGKRRPVAVRQGRFIPEVLIPDKGGIGLSPEHFTGQLKALVRRGRVSVYIQELPGREGKGSLPGAGGFGKVAAYPEAVKLHAGNAAADRQGIVN